MRIAWFTPLPPTRSGIAAYSAEVLSLLADRHRIDVFVDRATSFFQAKDVTPPPRPCRTLSAHDFVWIHRREPYDLIVYQLGNATCHDYMWPYLVRYPGVVVLHDAQLHHARARSLLLRQMRDEYRDEFRFCHPEAPPGTEELFIAGLGGALYYFWPMLNVAVRSARTVVVHSPRLASDLVEWFPEQMVESIRMGVADPFPALSAGLAEPPAAGERSRGSRGARSSSDPPAPLTFAAFGLVTPEKRISVILRALASTVAYHSEVRLMLVGDTADYYDALAEARELGVGDRVTVTGYVSEDKLPEYLQQADVCLCLRWPTGRETSASWLRCLAAGKPTVVTDLVHTVDVAALDPRTWTVQDASAGVPPEFSPHDDERDAPTPESRFPNPASPGSRSPNPVPVCVAIDILDEEHSLKVAMRRLATDARLRQQLGHAARAYWQRHHRIEHMARDYDRVFRRVAQIQSKADRDLPRHLLRDGTELLHEILRGVGLELPLGEAEASRLPLLGRPAQESH
jgi:glycosyltransferase involved in cell wall biosynthesis